MTLQKSTMSKPKWEQFYRQLEKQSDERRLKLFVAGCWYSVSCLLKENTKKIVLALEKSADGLINQHEFNSVEVEVLDNLYSTREKGLLPLTIYELQFLCMRSCADTLVARFVERFPYAVNMFEVFDDIFKNHKCKPQWRTPTTVAIAKEAYWNNADGKLPNMHILADALEEVGCSDYVLNHARSNRNHYRGCWLVDYLIGVI